MTAKEFGPSREPAEEVARGPREEPHERKEPELEQRDVLAEQSHPEGKPVRHNRRREDLECRFRAGRTRKK